MREIHGGSSSGSSGRVGGGKKDETLEATVSDHLFYRPQRSCGQGYVFTRVCDSFTGGGLRVGRPPGQGEPPRSRPPGQGEPHPGADTPPGSRLQHTVNEWPVSILLECILVMTYFYRVGERMTMVSPPPRTPIVDPLLWRRWTRNGWHAVCFCTLGPACNEFG